ncbi:unnamed protein product [Orchesella dallaii]|uniref:Tetraspanin n=1 Tax=Orchesella dallaii TaxID=48710 RepID=A0ABP1S0R4_9HEXA
MDSNLTPCNLFWILFITPLSLAIGLISLSFHLRSGYSTYFATVLNNEEWNHAMDTSIVLIVVGFLAIIYTGLLLIGLLMKKTRVLIVLGILMGILLLIVEVMATIIFIKGDNNMRVDITKAMNNSMENYYDINGPTHNSSIEFWDYLQINMKCCGVDSYAEWANAIDSPDLGFIPNSCCIKVTQHIEGSCTELITRNSTSNVKFASSFIYTDGCFNRFVSYYCSWPVLFVFLLGCFQGTGLSFLGLGLINGCNKYKRLNNEEGENAASAKPAASGAAGDSPKAND